MALARFEVGICANAPCARGDLLISQGQASCSLPTLLPAIQTETFPTPILYHVKGPPSQKPVF